MKLAVNELGCSAGFVLLKGYPFPLHFRYLKQSSLDAHSVPSE